MFSAQQLKNFAPKIKISQQTFDEAVHENIEEFGMEPDEALASAIAEFTAQGVDLQSIITTTAGGNTSSEPAVIATKAAKAAAERGDEEAAVKSLAVLVEALQAPNDNIAAIALSASSVDVVMCCLLASGYADPGENQPSCALLTSALQALIVLLPLSHDLRRAFRQADGPSTLVDLLNGKEKSLSSRPQAVAAAFRVGACSATRDEAGKSALMSSKLAQSAIEYLDNYAYSGELAEHKDLVILAACALFITLTTADDTSQPGSGAFANARSLAKDGAVEAVVKTLGNIMGDNNDIATESTSAVVIALCGALRQLAANDEACKHAAGKGAVRLALRLLDEAHGANRSGVGRAALAVLRQLASSDGAKAEIVKADGLDGLRKALAWAADIESASVAEQALGLLTNCTLRQPDVAEVAVSSGCANEVIRLMRSIMACFPTSKDERASDVDCQNSLSSLTSRASAALRQGCMAVRNMAVRSPEARTALLNAGAAEIVREAKLAYPNACEDVGLAALRDLGLEFTNGV